MNKKKWQNKFDQRKAPSTPYYYSDGKINPGGIASTIAALIMIAMIVVPLIFLFANN